MNRTDPSTQLWWMLTCWTMLCTLLLVVMLGLLGAAQMGIGLMIGVLTLGGILVFYAWLVRRFAQPGSHGFRRRLLLSGMVKYPILMLVIYLVVQGGTQMALGFAVGVLLPLAVLTILALRMNH